MHSSRIPPRRPLGWRAPAPRPHAPRTPPPSQPAPPAPPPRAPLVVRAFTSPVTPGAVERRLQRQLAPALSWLWIMAVLCFVVGLTWVGWSAWNARIPMLTPRHRAEALCFALESPPHFTPPMTIEPTAALVRGRFTRETPAAMALQNAMNFSDEMVESQTRQHVGDYDVTITWLRLPDAGGPAHWLILCWMEDADLAVCSFRFAGDDPLLTPDQLLWGRVLMARLLIDSNFQAGVLPHTRLRIEPGAPLPPLGPPPARTTN